MRRLTASAFWVVLFVSVAWSTVPALLRLTAQSLELRRHSYRQRRVRVLGPFYERTRAFRGDLAPGESVAIIAPAQSDLDAALFFDYYLYPRMTRLYRSLDDYRNAGSEPDRPSTLVLITNSASELPRRVSYAEAREALMGNDLVVRGARALGVPARSFTIPMVASIDGGGSNVYTTEAVIANDNPSAAHVTFELLPARQIVQAEIAAGSARRWNDVVYQLFGVLQHGWLRVTADVPVRTGFWFVNRGSRRAVELPNQISPVRQSSIVSPEGSRLFVLNPNAVPVGVDIDGAVYYSPPFAMTEVPGGNRVVRCREPIYPFASWRGEGGATRFVWPDGEQ